MRSRKTALGIAALGLAAIAPGPAVAADGRCAHDPATATTTVTVGPGGGFAGTLFVNFEEQLQIDDADVNPPDPPCGATTNTDTIAITGMLDGDDDVFSISNNTANRGFEPGLTDEVGSSDEIEFVATVTGGQLGIDNGLVGVGSSRDSATVLGGSEINMNAAEADGVDADVTLAGPRSVLVEGDDREDLVDGGGGAGTPATPFALPIYAEGLDGDDRLTGGAEGDELFGSPGADRLNGEGGDDRRLQGGEDDDKLNGGDGKDKLFGEEGDDILKGGPGRDVCDGGPGHDIFRQCEVERG